MEKLKKWLNKHCTVNWRSCHHIYSVVDDVHTLYFYPPHSSVALKLHSSSKKKIKDYLKGQGLWKD